MSTPHAAASRFLQRLASDGFTPSAKDVEAVAAAGAAQVPRGSDEQAAAFAAEVGAFAADYWDLTSGARRKRWAALSARAFGPAAARLAELEAGLEVVPAPLPDTIAAAVADLARELYTLPPTARAARRLAWLRADNRRDPGWVAAVRTVLRTDLPLARLEPRLFDWYSLNLVPHPVAAVADEGGWLDRTGRDVNFNPAPAAAPAASQPAAGFGCGGYWLWIIVVSAVVRLLLAASGSQSL